MTKDKSFLLQAFWSVMYKICLPAFAWLILYDILYQNENIISALENCLYDFPVLLELCICVCTDACQQERGGWGKVPGDYFYADPGFKYLDKVLVGAD